MKLSASLDGVDGASQRLGKYSGGVVDGIGHQIELALVGDQRLAPGPARIAAKARLDAGADVAARDVATQRQLAHGAGIAQFLDPAHAAAQRRLDHDAVAH